MSLSVDIEIEVTYTVRGHLSVPLLLHSYYFLPFIFPYTYIHSLAIFTTSDIIPKSQCLLHP
jgi:hypothetical protein